MIVWELFGSFWHRLASFSVYCEALNDCVRGVIVWELRLFVVVASYWFLTFSDLRLYPRSTSRSGVTSVCFFGKPMRGGAFMVHVLAVSWFSVVGLVGKSPALCRFDDANSLFIRECGNLSVFVWTCEMISGHLPGKSSTTRHKCLPFLPKSGSLFYTSCCRWRCCTMSLVQIVFCILNTTPALWRLVTTRRMHLAFFYCFTSFSALLLLSSPCWFVGSPQQVIPVLEGIQRKWGVGKGCVRTFDSMQIDEGFC